jgi:putative nucleotidyltransferase with HDIG domain
MSRIQLHSIATASAAEMIASMSKMSKEEAFLGGLLHDVGMVLTYRLMKNSIEATGDEWIVDQGTLRRMARKYHQRLGALFLSGWELAGSVATMIAFHHHPDEAEEKFQPHAKCIHIADALAERAVTHSKSPKWKRSIANHNPDATEEERSRAADVDGINEISVHDLLFQAPQSLDIVAMHGIIRSVLLKLDSRRSEEGDDGKDEDAAATSSGT